MINDVFFYDYIATVFYVANIFTCSLSLAAQAQ